MSFSHELKELYRNYVESEAIYHFNEMVNQDIIDPDEQLYIACLACFKQEHITDDDENIHFSKYLEKTHVHMHSINYHELKW